MGEGDLERERDETVCEGHEQVGDHGGEPAPDYQLVEVHWRVALGSDVFGVDGEKEAKAEEGDDYEVDEADTDSGGGGRGGEGAEVENTEADGGVEGLR